MKPDPSYSFHSPIPEIRNLRVYALPKGDSAIDLAKIARHGETTVYQDKAGKLYSAGVRGNNSAVFCFGRGRPDDYVRIFSKLGLITKAQAAKHLKLATADDARHAIRQKAQHLIESAHKLGLKLTKPQLKFIQKLRNPKY